MMAWLALCAVTTYAQQNLVDSIKTMDLKEVVVSSTRATDNTPVTFNEIDEEQIEKNNMGKDMPYILEMTPSAVVTSDAGAGVGYTGIRIRGSDATRVNITINGIPYNDSESQGTFWVNLPDFASSVSSIQVQRGVGTSTNGAGAFGASVNIETSQLNKKAYATLDNAYGSFNTRKHTLMMGTGLINGKFAFDGRISQIASDGYIDRATSDLNSYFLSGGYYGKKSLVKFNIFSGHEVTYQSWYGTPESRVNGDVEEMEAYIARNWLSEAEAENLLNSGRTYNYYTYDNEVDDYQQTHYQLITAFDLSELLTLNVALHYTHGEGFFEQYKADESFSDYGLDDIVIDSTTISSTDLIRRRWLDNDFYGTTFSLDYAPSKSLNVTLGGAWNQYDGDHFGEIIWAQYASNGAIRHRYYDNVGKKTDFNTYIKADWRITDNLSLYGDIQARTVDYSLEGLDSDRLMLDESHNFFFLNPKFGASYALNESTSLYASYAIGNKEPARSDFTDHPDASTPKAESMQDIEIGFKKRSDRLYFEANGYYMIYKDQLVLNGDLNDVGSPLRQNVDKSFRRGIELQATYHLSQILAVSANATLSQNKIEDYTEYIYNYGEDWDEYNRDEIQHGQTDIAFSPSVIAGGNITATPTKGLSLAWIHKYVGKQYLDNTSTDSRSISEYYISDFVANYELEVRGLKSVGLRLGVYNIFNTLYSANGYTWGYRGGGEEVRENFYYPQAGTNYMLGLTIKI